MTKYHEITIDGVRYVPDPEQADAIKFYFMHENHTFTELHGSIDEIIHQATELVKNGPLSAYGMLCGAILMRNGKEINRVGENAHGRGRDLEAFASQIKRWRDSVEPAVAKLMGCRL